MSPRETLEYILQGHTLTRPEAAATLRQILDGGFNPESLAGLLAAMRLREETTDELLGFLDVLDERANKVPYGGKRLLDTCGTGGDGLGTFNVSTASAVVVAAAGVPIAKHGNRSVSSKSGSSDVLEAAGVPLTGDISLLAEALDTLGLAFLFAPFHHPALKAVAGVRKAMRVMTVFNQLGPLANPAPVTHQYVGVSQPRLLTRYGEILRARGIRAGIVHGRAGADEALPGGEFTWVRVATEDDPIEAVVQDPTAFGVPAFEVAQFQGGDAEANARVLWALLEGAGPEPLVHAVALNAGLALCVGEETSSPAEGYQLALEVLKSGEPARLLRSYAALVSR